MLARIFLAVRELYKKEAGALPDAVLNASWGYSNPVNPDLGEVLKEINGKALADIPDPKDSTKILVKAGDQVTGFGQLTDDGSTMCGNWLHSGCFTPAGNLAQRRNNADPTGLGMYHDWGFAWPANRRVMYMRENRGIRRVRASSGTARNGQETFLTSSRTHPRDSSAPSS